MSFGGFFRSLSEKVSKGLDEIKAKSNEASSDIARGMREIREGVGKLGVALHISDANTHLYTDVDETAGMKLAAHYSHAIVAIRENNQILMAQGDKAAHELSRVHQRVTKDHEAMKSLIKQCDTLPELVSSIDVVKSRCEKVLEKLASVEALLGDTWEDTVISQISTWKQAREAELEDYRKAKRSELAKVEEQLRAQRDAKIAEKRNKALARAAQLEQHESSAHSALQEQLDASIKKNMEEYFIYSFSSKPSTSSSGSATGGIGPNGEPSASEQDPASALASIDIQAPKEEADELDSFLGPSEQLTPVSLDQDEEEPSAIKVDDTTIDAPEP